ncbi:unnamed protein product [Amoebophrya sp. A120]|nr:unnamed protein product [Amoebophrya sp. A120]|eukprot:GSA120T00017462001.1
MILIPAGLVPYRVCNRTFPPDRMQLQEHKHICMRTNAKKRRVYNSAKHRVPTDRSSFGARFVRYLVTGVMQDKFTEREHAQHAQSKCMANFYRLKAGICNGC